VLGYLGELAVEFAPPHQADERLFRMVRACLEAAAARPETLHAVAVYYELWMLKIGGFLPELRRCGACARAFAEAEARVYATPEGVLRCAACAVEGDAALDSGAYAQLRQLRGRGPSAWADAYGALPRAGRQRLSDLTRRLIRRALEKELKGPNAYGAGGAARLAETAAEAGAR
jgi:DNA repair protein RecO (recombination protein O)